MILYFKATDFNSGKVNWKACVLCQNEDIVSSYKFPLKMFKTSSQFDATRRARFTKPAHNIAMVWQFLLFPLQSRTALYVGCGVHTAIDEALQYRLVEWINCGHTGEQIDMPCDLFFGWPGPKSHCVRSYRSRRQLPRIAFFDFCSITWEETETTKRILAMLVLVS